MSRNQIYSGASMEKGAFILSQMTAICPVHAAFAENKTCPVLDTASLSSVL